MHAQTTDERRSVVARLLSRSLQCLLVCVCAALAGCAAPNDGQAPEVQQTVSAALNSAPPERPPLAATKEFRKAPAFKRATQAEVEAFLAHGNGGNPKPQLSTAEVDAIIADAAARDEGTRRDGMKRFHEAIRTMPSAESRQNAIARLRVAMAGAK